MQSSRLMSVQCFVRYSVEHSITCIPEKNNVSVRPSICVYCIVFPNYCFPCVIIVFHAIAQLHTIASSACVTTYNLNLFTIYGCPLGIERVYARVNRLKGLKYEKIRSSKGTIFFWNWHRGTILMPWGVMD